MAAQPLNLAKANEGLKRAWWNMSPIDACGEWSITCKTKPLEEPTKEPWGR